MLVWARLGRAGREDRDTMRALWRRAQALRTDGIDLALDLQGDLRAAFLMAMTGARRRVSYASTGGAVPAGPTWWPWTDGLVGGAEPRRGGRRHPRRPGPRRPFDPDTADRDGGERLIAELGLRGRRPLVGCIPAAGGR